MILFQILTSVHVSHRRHVPAANILIEGIRFTEHCASHKQAKPKCEKRESEHVVVLIKVAMVNILWLCGDGNGRIAVGNGWWNMVVWCLFK